MSSNNSSSSSRGETTLTDDDIIKIIDDDYQLFYDCRRAAATVGGNDDPRPFSIFPLIISSDDPSMAFFNHNTKTSTILRPPRIKSHYPVDHITTSTFDIDLLLYLSRLNHITISNNLLMMLDWINTDVLADVILNDFETLNHHQPQRRPISRCFMQQDFDELNKIFDTSTTPRLVMPAFKVSKAKKPFARFILDARPFNSIFSRHFDLPHMRLERLDDAVRAIAVKNWGTQFDMANFFFQFRIGSRTLRSLFGCRIACGRGTFTEACLEALPQGLCFAPTLAQETARLITELTITMARPLLVAAKLPLDDLAHLEWLDNFFFAADDRRIVVIVGQAFLDVCKLLRLHVKESASDPTPLRHFDALGIKFDLEHHKISLAAPPPHLHDLVRNNISLRQLYHVFGNAVFHSFVISKRPLCEYPHLLHAVATHARDHPRWDERISLSPNAVAELKCIATKLTKNTPISITESFDHFRRSHTPPTTTTTTTSTWADASNTGIAGIVQSNPPFSWNAPRHDDAPIWQAELLAAVITQDIASLTTPPSHVLHLHEDNTTAASVLRKGHTTTLSMNMFLNAWIFNNNNINNNTRSNNTPCPWQRTSVTWVPSSEQLADTASRLYAEALQF